MTNDSGVSGYTFVSDAWLMVGLPAASWQLVDQEWARSDQLHFCRYTCGVHTMCTPSWPPFMITGLWCFNMLNKKAKAFDFWIMIDDKGCIIGWTREAPQWLSQLCGGAGPSLFDESAQRRNSNFSLNWFDVFKLWFHFLDGCRNMLRQRWKMAEESFCSSWSSQSCKKWFK